MLLRHALFAGTLLVAAGAANAHTLTIFGRDADAHACYDAARFDTAHEVTLPMCTRALAGNLSEHDRMATFVNRGILRMRTRDVDGAISDFDAATAIEADQPDALINKSIALLSRGGSDDVALDLINRALANQPERPWVGYWARAMANELAGRVSEAYYDYRRAEELRPGWAPARQALARFSVRS